MLEAQVKEDGPLTAARAHADWQVHRIHRLLVEADLERKSLQVVLAPSANLLVDVGLDGFETS